LFYTKKTLKLDFPHVIASTVLMMIDQHGESDAAHPPPTTVLLYKNLQTCWVYIGLPAVLVMNPTITQKLRVFFNSGDRILCP